MSNDSFPDCLRFSGKTDTILGLKGELYGYVGRREGF